MLKEVQARNQEIEELRKKARKRKDRIRELQREIVSLRDDR